MKTGATGPAATVRLPAAQRRASILVAARDLFIEKGFAQTTTRQIAERAGVTDALIYRHFPAKQALLEALVDETIERLISLPRPTDGPLVEVLAGIGQAVVNTLETHAELLALLVGEHRNLQGDARFVRFIDGAARGLGQLISANLAAPDLERGYLLARAYIGSLIAFILLQRTLGMDKIHPVETSNYVAIVAQTFADGITLGAR